MLLCEKYTQIGKRSFTSQKRSGKQQNYTMKISWKTENRVFSFLDSWTEERKTDKCPCSEKITRFQFRLFKVSLNRIFSNESDWIVVDVRI